MLLASAWVLGLAVACTCLGLAVFCWLTFDKLVVLLVVELDFVTTVFLGQEHANCMSNSSVGHFHNMVHTNVMYTNT